MLKVWKKAVSVCLLAALVIGLFTGVAVKTVLAATDSLKTLAANGQVKLLGRTAPGTNGLMADWPGNGFEMNVSGSGGKLQVGVSTNYAANWTVLVDGEQVYWERLSATGGTISASIPAGKHLVSVIKESDNQGKATDYCDLTTLSFPGTIEKAPADKETLIEFIGDSYTAGWGTLGTYNPGTSWTGYDHSFTHGFAYYCSRILDADYTIAARGGIGLFDGVSAEQPDDDPDATIADIYPYTAGFRTSAGLYDFAKQPDVVIIELGANDSIKETDANFTSAKWKQLLEEFTDTVREKNPNAAIVFLSHRAQKFRIMMQIVEERKATDPNLYAFSFAHQGNGSGGSTQYYGHPNAEDSYALAEALAAFLQENSLVPVQQEETSAYTDYVYYASENGSDSADGKTLATAKKTLVGALKQAKADHAAYPAGSRVVVNVQGAINNSSGNSQMFADAGGTLKSSDGKNLPVLIQTYNYSGTKAVVDTNHQPSDASSCLVYCCNEITLKDITLQSTTYADKGTRDNIFYSGYFNVTFDNVTFAQSGATPTALTDRGWMVSATHVIGTVAVPTEPTNVTVTFLNGDYTNLAYVTPVRVSALYRSAADGGNITDCTNLHSKIVIGSGAKVNKVFNRYGTLRVGSSTVEVRGGTVNNYYGTTDGTDAANQRDLTGDVNFVMTGGNVYGNSFHTAGSNVTIDGDLNNTISGGRIYVRPTVKYDGIYFGGRAAVTVNNINNTISGGQFLMQCDAEALDVGFHFGGSSNANIKGNVTNKISGGSFVPMNGACKTTCNIYFGHYSGKIAGTLHNEITGGTFDASACNSRAYYMGCRNANSPIGKVVNVIGTEGSDQGPMFRSYPVYLAGGWAQIGVQSARTAMPDVSECTDAVAVSSTVYGCGVDSYLYCGPTAANTGSYYSFVLGSIETNIYGGQLLGTVYGAGSSAVYGKVSTNIHGGVVANVYGNNDAAIYDGVELNITGVTEYYNVNKTNTWHFWAGAYNADIPVPQTEGRPSVKLTVAGDMTLNTPLCATCRTGKALGETVVEVSGGVYPKGFRVAGVKVREALAEGYMPMDTAGKILAPGINASETGTTQVSVVRVYEIHSTCDTTVAPTYTTDPSKAVARPEHVFENGVCANCGAVPDHVMDLDGNGKVNAFDAQLLAEARAGLRTLSDAQWAALGDLTSRDILDFILGK